MNVKEKLVLLEFLYGSSRNANVLNKVFQETVLQDEDVRLLKESIENDYFLGEKGKELQKKGLIIYQEIMSSPNDLRRLIDELQLYMKSKDKEKCSIDKVAEKIVIEPSDYSLIEYQDKEILEQYFIERYKTFLYTIVTLGGKNSFGKIRKFVGNDLYNWLVYFKENKLLISENSLNSWVIYFHDYSDLHSISSLTGYELVYYKGPAKFHNLVKEEGIVQYTPWLYGNKLNKKQGNRRILCFGMGNITNVTVNLVEDIFKKGIYTKLPKEGVFDYSEDANPIDVMNNLYGNKGMLFCVTPHQYVSVCNAIYQRKKWENRHINKARCPICNRILQEGQKICMEHCKEV